CFESCNHFNLFAIPFISLCVFTVKCGAPCCCHLRWQCRQPQCAVGNVENISRTAHRRVKARKQEKQRQLLSKVDTHPYMFYSHTDRLTPVKKGCAPPT